MRPRRLKPLKTAPCRKGGRPCKKATPRPGGIAIFGDPSNTKVFGDPEAENKQEGGWGS